MTINDIVSTVIAVSLEEQWPLGTLSLEVTDSTCASISQGCVDECPMNGVKVRYG